MKKIVYLIIISLLLISCDGMYEGEGWDDTDLGIIIQHSLIYD